MNSPLIENLTFVNDTIKDIDEVKTNLYLLRAIRMYIKEPVRTWIDEVVVELGRVVDGVRINRYHQSTESVMKKLNVLFPCQDIIDASIIIDTAIKNERIYAKNIFASVIKFQSARIEVAKNKLKQA